MPELKATIMTNISARTRRANEALTETLMLKVITGILPRANGYCLPDCGSLLDETRLFGIKTVGQFRRLLLRHRRALIRDDRDALTDWVFMYAIAEDHGEATVRTMRLKQRCFTWEAFVRNAMELEFGSAYEEYARRRDGIEME